MKSRAVVFLASLMSALASESRAQAPAEPLSISRGEPQFIFDFHLVDNHWAIRYKNQVVSRIWHAPRKHAANPLRGFEPFAPSYVAVVKDAVEPGREVFRMYFQANILSEDLLASDPDRDRPAGAAGKGRVYRTEIACAESDDGIEWTFPNLDFFPEKTGGNPNPFVVGFPGRPEVEACAPLILENLPEADRRGFRHLLLYRAKGRGAGDVAGIRLVGTRDGLRFDPESDTRIAHLASDHHNSISYDPASEGYLMFCRAKQIYRAFGEEMIDTGASRRIATMRSSELWTDWMAHSEPRTLLVPDEKDAETRHNFFYGMPTVHRYGVFWGFLEPFRMNDYIHTELATSRDGEHWQRLPERPKLIEYGPDGSWDDTMIFVSPAWIEIGNEWRFYYTGWDGPHDSSDRKGNVGLAICKRERLISLRGPDGGGVVCTRTLVWPGGDLWLNAAPVGDENAKITVRISEAGRKVIEGFDHAESELSGDDETRQVVRWNSERSLGDLGGQTIRIEVFLQNADLFSLGATPGRG